MTDATDVMTDAMIAVTTDAIDAMTDATATISDVINIMALPRGTLS